jgi:hypothetical protein
MTAPLRKLLVVLITVLTLAVASAAAASAAHHSRHRRPVSKAKCTKRVKHGRRAERNKVRCTRGRTVACVHKAKSRRHRARIARCKAKSTRKPAAPSPAGVTPSSVLTGGLTLPAAAPDAGAPWPSGYQIGLYGQLRARTGADLENTVSRMVASGVQFTREDFSWTVLEPQPNVYRWQSTDAFMLVAASHGLHVMATPGGSPSWIQSSWNVGPTSTSAVPAYAEFVRQLVARYGSQGSFWTEHPTVPKVPIEMYDLWNEPYTPQFWSPGPNPALYAQMFKAAVAAARPADPSAKFLLEANPGSFASGSPPFLAAMFAAVPDLGAYADAVSVHPYASSGWSPSYCTRYSPSRGLSQDWHATQYETCRVTDIRQILNANHATKTRIWMTEVGYSTTTSSSSGVTESRQASYVHALFSLLRGPWKSLVSGVQWYQYEDVGTAPAYGDHFGLLRADGSPKPAWAAFVSEAQRGF